MRIKAVLFDMDGTVLDTLEDLYRAVNHSLGVFGLPPVSREQVRACLNNGAARLIGGCLPPDSSPELARQVLEDYMPYYEAHCNEQTRPYEGIVQLMQELRAEGISLAVVSNKPDGAVRELAEEHFPGLLTAAVGEREGVKRKPDPSSVLAAAALLGVPKEQCAYVGDSDVDVQTARNAGIPCVAVTWGFRNEAVLLAAGAERLAHSAEELKKILEKI